MTIKAKPFAIGLVVADMAESLAFYRDLGLDIPADADKEPHAQAELTPGFLLMWDTVDVIQSIDPEWVAPVGGAKASLAFECETPADVDRLYADLVAAGHHGHKEPWNAFWGQRYAIVQDPDGNDVGLFTNLPG